MQLSLNQARRSASFSTVRRWLLVILLVIVPFQFAWSTAAGYCRHEVNTGAAHFGHHDHHAKASLGDKARDVKLKQIADGDDDCVTCHVSLSQPTRDAGFASTPVDAMRPHEAAQRSYRSHIPIGLERPARRLAI